MEALLHFAVWAVLIFLVMRFGCGAHVMGHDRGGKPADGADASTGGQQVRWIPPKRNVDPVCGTTVRTAAAKSSVFDCSVYYFCSRDCREIFEAAPDHYLGGGISKDPRQLEQSHV